jgi:hypothetical protein
MMSRTPPTSFLIVATMIGKQAISAVYTTLLLLRRKKFPEP